MSQSLTLNPSAEVMYIAANSPTTAYSGGDFTIGERNDQITIVKRSLIKFDLSSLPNGAFITSAKIRLYLWSDKSSTSATMNIYGVKRAWVQGEASWNNWSTGNAWGTAGAANTTSDIYPTPYGTRAMSASEAVGYKDFDLTASDVQNWVDGTVDNNGVLFWSSVESNDGYIYYSNATGSSTQKPELVLTYENRLYPADWSGSYGIQSDYTKVSGSSNLTDFPALISDGNLSSDVYAGLSAHSNYSLDLTPASNQYASITDASQTGLDITGDITIEAWIKVDAVPSAFGASYDIVRKWVSSPDLGYLCYISSSGDKLSFYYSGTGADTNLTLFRTSSAFITSSDVGKWVHLAVVVDVSAHGLAIYKNGVAVGTENSGTSASSIYNSSAPFGIGGLSGTSELNGRIKSVRIWNDLRTASEVADNMYNLNLTAGVDNLVEEWKLNNDYTSLSGNNTLTASGSPVFVVDTPLLAMDLRITTDSAGTTEVPFEIVSLDTTAETCEIWAKVPTLNYNSATPLYIWYGNSSVLPYSATDTFGSENVWTGFQSVSHLETNTLDSTGTYNGTNNAVTFAAGQIGNDGVFSSAYVEYSNTLKRIGNTNCAISMWFKTSSASQQFLYGEGSTSSNFPLLQLYILSGQVYLSLRNDTGSSSASTTPTQTGLADGNWHHAYFTKTTTGYETFIDGVSDGTMTSSIVPTVNRVGFGALLRASVGIYLSGNAGEFRFKDDIPTDDWIVTEYNNQNLPSTFWGPQLTTVDTSIQAKARVKYSAITKTVTAKARIKLPTTKTVTAKARIKQLDNIRTVTAKARVKIASIKTVTAKARVKNVSLQTVQARARVKRSNVTKTIQSKARIKYSSVTKSVQAKANILVIVTNTKTVTAKARIKVVNNIKTVTAKARIATAGITKSIQAKARVLFNQIKTVTAKARVLFYGDWSETWSYTVIIPTVTQTVTAKARIKSINVQQTIQAKARVKLLAVTKTIDSKARILFTGTTQSIQAKARIKLLSNTKTIQAKARIKYSSVTKSIQAKARVKYADVIKSIDSKARILLTKTQSITAKARVLFNQIKTVTAKARVKLQTTQIITARARIRNTSTQTVQAKARISSTGTTQTITAKARVKIVSTTQTVTSKARVKYNSVTKTVQARARILSNVLKTVTAKSRVKLLVEKTVSALADIKKLGQTKTITAKARIKYSNVAKTIQARSRIKTLDNVKSIQTKARVLFRIAKTIQSKARIKVVSTKTVTSKARIVGNGATTTISSKARIKTPDITKSIQAKARIKLVDITQTVQSKSRVKNFTTKTVDALARILKNKEAAVQAKARITTEGNTVSISAKARVLTVNNVRTVTAKARVKYSSVLKTILSKARIKLTGISSIQSKARIKLSEIQSIAAKARIKQSVIRTILSKASIKFVRTQTIEAKAAVAKTTVQTIQAKAAIRSSAELKTIQAKARVKIANVTQVIQAKANILLAPPINITVTHGTGLEDAVDNLTVEGQQPPAFIFVEGISAPTIDLIYGNNITNGKIIVNQVSGLTAPSIFKVV